MNIASSVAIVVTNKLLYSVYGLANVSTSIIAFHFACTFIGLYFASGGYQDGKGGWLFERKVLPLRAVFPLAIAFCAFVVLTNLSLVHNSVGMYQMTKVLTTPTIVIINFLVYRKRYGRKEIAALFITCVGVIIVSASDTNLNFLGMIFALTGVLVTSIYQIWVGTKQASLQATSAQLLLYQSIMSAVLLLPVIPLLDTFPTPSPYVRPQDIVADQELASAITVPLILSAIAALGVNLSQFLIIGKTSAVTYNVVGHAKTCLVLVIGWIMFGGFQTGWAGARMVAGVLLALAGVGWYSYLQSLQR